MIHPFIEATLLANESIAKAMQTTPHPQEWYKKGDIGAGGDESSGLDLFAEDIFVSYLQRFGTIESEESGIFEGQGGRIILDPIDGSDNALSSLPYFGTSVAFINPDGLLECAIVCNLANHDVFWTQKSQGTYHGKLFSNKWELVQKRENPPFGLFERSYAFPQVAHALYDNQIKYRSLGAAALSLAYGHWNRFVLLTGSVRIYDVAAGLALCEGLEVIIQEDYVIVAQEKEILTKIEEIILSCKEQI